MIPPREQTEAERPKGGKGGLVLRLALAVGALVVLIAIGRALGLQEYLTVEGLSRLTGTVEDHHVLALLLFVVIYAALVAISFPGATFLTIAGGYLFGQITGTAAVVVAATIGSTIIFALARWVFRDALRKRAEGVIGRMERGFREDALSYMFLLRLVPAFPFVAINIGAGVIGVPLRTYVIGTFFGIVPGTFVYVSIGTAIRAGQASVAETGLLSVFAEPRVYLPFIGLAVLAALPILLKRFGGQRARRLAEAEGETEHG